MSKSRARRIAFRQKTNELEWGETQPLDLEKHDWIGSTARRYGAKRLDEAAADCTALRHNDLMWTAS